MRRKGRACEQREVWATESLARWRCGRETTCRRTQKRTRAAQGPANRGKATEAGVADARQALCTIRQSTAMVAETVASRAQAAVQRPPGAHDPPSRGETFRRRRFFRDTARLMMISQPADSPESPDLLGFNTRPVPVGTTSRLCLRVCCLRVRYGSFLLLCGGCLQDGFVYRGRWDYSTSFWWRCSRGGVAWSSLPRPATQGTTFPNRAVTSRVGSNLPTTISSAHLPRQPGRERERDVRDLHRPPHSHRLLAAGRRVRRIVVACMYRTSPWRLLHALTPEVHPLIKP